MSALLNMIRLPRQRGGGSSPEVELQIAQTRAAARCLHDKTCAARLVAADVRRARVRNGFAALIREVWVPR